MQVYHQFYEYIIPLKATLIAKIRCPFCAVAKRRLDWLQNSLYPKFSSTTRYAGDIRTNTNFGTMYTLDEYSDDREITSIARQLTSKFYPGESENLPITIIGDLSKFSGYKKKPSVIFGCDKFMPTLPKEAYPLLTEDEMELIRKGELDGIRFTEEVYYKYIYGQTKIHDEYIVETLNKQSEIADSIKSRVESPKA